MKKLMILSTLILFVFIWSKGYIIDDRGILYQKSNDNIIPINKIDGRIVAFHYIGNDNFYIQTENYLYIGLNNFKKFLKLDIQDISEKTIEDDHIKYVFPDINDVDIHDSQIAIISDDTLYLGDIYTKKFISKRFSDFYLFSVKFYNNKIYLGTSQHGVIVLDKQLNYTLLYKGLYQNTYSQNVYYFEEITSMAKLDHSLFIALNFGINIYQLNDNKWKLIVNFYNNEAVKRLYVSKRAFIVVNNSENVIVLKNGSYYKSIPAYFNNKNEKNFIYGIFFNKGLIYEKHRKVQKKIVSPLRAIYIPENKINYFVKNIKDFKKYHFNGVVFPLKTDLGYILFKPKNKIYIKTGAFRYAKNWHRILKKAHKNGFKVIARLVCFKDSILFNYENGKYAFWDVKKEQPWIGKEAERWVDPYSSFVRNYLIEIAKELENIGFDEIQLDYIRFPTDGDQTNRVSLYKLDNISKENILAAFLREIKENIHIPLSIDVYGLQGWYNYPGTPGQNVQLFSKYIDILSPMLYPSHFNQRFFQDTDEKQRAYNIIYIGSIRNKNKFKNVIIRPYIQAFRWGVKNYNIDYLNTEIKALKDAGINQYILWGLDYK